jgi:sulfur dioxygenase
MSDNLIFQQLFESQSSTFTYLLADKETREAVLIDSVLETVDRDLRLLEELDLKLKYVLDTHIHADHVTGAGEIRNRLGIKTGVAKTANVPCVDINLSENDQIKFGNFSIKVLETPGHTDASLSFYCEGMIFTGDALLIRGCGRTDFQSGSAETLYESVTKKLFSLPADTKVYPAHDYKGFTSSSIDAEKKNNPRLGRGKTKAEFVEIMANLKLAYPKQIDRAVPANLSCGVATDPSASIPQVTPHDVVSRGDSRRLIVDVRRDDEINAELGHISGAHHVVLGPALRHFLEGYDRKEGITFVCRSGSRSQEAAKMALELGYEDIENMQGGMLKWNELGLPVARA